MSAPLHRVIGIVEVEADQYGSHIRIPRVALECGHTLGIKEDRSPLRRRCWKCDRDFPVEIEQEATQ